MILTMIESFVMFGILESRNICIDMKDTARATLIKKM